MELFEILLWILTAALWLLSVLWVGRDADRLGVPLSGFERFAICLLWPMSLMGYFILKEKRIGQKPKS